LTTTVGKYLLDSNIVIAIVNEEEAATKYLATAEQAFVSTTVLGELFYGAQISQRVSDNLAEIDAFVRRVTVLDCNIETARFYGEIRGDLKRRGKPIPDNDIWIAAIARQHDLFLATRDVHFRHVPNLTVVDWR
jgi:tRNA(fMet)-specific endonuclease VapC